MSTNNRLEYLQTVLTEQSSENWEWRNDQENRQLVIDEPVEFEK